jgi:nucleoside-diphosphate-sugar epimerase
MSILITGGTGFIGAEVARWLVQGGVGPVAVFDLRTSHQRLDDIAERIEIIQGDLGIFSHVLNAVSVTKPKTIYHFGGMLTLPSDADPPAAFRANAMGTFHVLEAARMFEVDQVIFSSSRQTYGLDIQNEITDLTLQRPQMFYGVCKLFGEHMGLFYRRKYGIDFRGIRYPAIAGPGARTPGAVQYISWMIEGAARGKPFTVWVKPETKAPFLYFKDAARAAVQLAQSSIDEIKTVNYVLSGVTPTPSAGELAQAVQYRIPGAQISYEPDEELQSILDKALLPIDETCARVEWGWRTEYDLDKLVDDFIKELAVNPQRYKNASPWLVRS